MDTRASVSDPFRCSEVRCDCGKDMLLVGAPVSGTEQAQYVEDTRLYRWAVIEAAKHGVDLSEVDMKPLVEVLRARL